MGLSLEKNAFFTNLDQLGKEIRNHRDAIINKEFLFSDSYSINELVNAVKGFKDKISNFKKKIALDDLKKDVDRYLVSEINYLDNITNSMRVILKNVNSNVHSDNYIMENNLLYQTALISKLSSDIDDLEKTTLYNSFFTKGVSVSVIDGKSIKSDLINKYNT